MNPFLRIPIRIQLIIIVLIVALPAAGIIAYSGAQFRKSSEAHARIATQTLVDVAASEQRMYTASAEQLLVTLSELPQLSQKRADETSRFLARVHRLHPNYMNIYVADATGVIWASAPSTEATVNISDRRYFRNAMASGRFSSGEFQIGRISNQPTLNVGYPFWDAKGGRVGVIGLGIPLDMFHRLYDIANIPAGGNLVLLDHKGTILFDSSDKANLGKPFHPGLFNRMQKGADAGTSTAVGVAGDSPGKERYVSYRKLYLENESTPYMYIWVGIPAESALADANRQILKTVAAFSAVLAAALLIAWLFAERSIATRISALQRAAEKLAQGDLGARVPASERGGDLDRLGESFNVMAGQLALREQNLARSQAFLNTVIDTQPECLIILDCDGKIIMENRAGMEMMEVESSDQVEGRNFASFIPGHFRNEFLSFLEEVCGGRAGKLEFEIVNFRGKHLWLDIRAVPFAYHSEDKVHFLGIARDITERRLREQLLLQREAELKKAQQLAQLGSWTYDVTSGLLTWSDELYRIYGVPREDFHPTVESFLNLIHPDDSMAMRAWIESCEAGNSPRKLEFRIIRPDGAVRSVVGHGELQCSGDGSVCTVSGTAQDITERKAIEDALLEKRLLLEQMNKNLEERVLSAVSELRKKDQMLIQQSRQAALGEMIGNIAHQWRQPLNAIGLVVQELEMTFGRPEFDREYLAAHVRRAMALVNHMSKTIDNFASYFKPERLRTRFNVNKVTSEALAMIEPAFTSSGIRLVVNEKDALEVDGFGKEFSQVVLNIILNARDAYKDAEPAQEKLIEITLFREGDNAVVTIADHAGGIPHEIIDSIFDPYFTTKGPDKGTGIGLYMSKMIIEQHMGGKLTARNVDGGAEFRIEV